ncbi:diguanylate phosphodiesterase [Enterobacter pasteurii]|uniref:Diguanylate phosphodiesterase n=1 Tax=Enterobacter pasteurii TaxID=3029761 RepID=A0ABR9Q215_9ENTR|nr:MULTISPECIES: diguanylate phosphodiesterase [Enterobacter cloacae complex]MBE4852851.1 diguanylate phosphodiesterase [Enterobacter pasteurii]MBE4861922.1 diguanylate phosphodiesterase [Enterobacter cloacae complex sp. P40C2]MBE4877882.1 diguanylate phosphodiesterase [Enterobacter cloacae complex sp. P40C]MCY0771565.1 diguanylate phosphodiesterase [Enterobacter cloacae complex sp. 2022EL-00788]QLA66737.1 diguanylate phosphodiesterase [Enterobacter pasteurii]
MLTTIIYRSHICEDVPVKALEDMVAAANCRNRQFDVTGILLFNGTHFFQLLEGPAENVREIYQLICQDPRHHNVVELLSDHGPLRRFGNAGMELFDLRQYDTDEVLQQVLDKGTTKYQLTYSDRALQFFRTFVEATEKANYFELPPADSWDFVSEETALSSQPAVVPKGAECSFAFQPIVDPFMQQVVSWEALIRTPDGDSPEAYFANQSSEALYDSDLKSKQVALSMASALGLQDQTLCINLLPMTLVNVPGAVDFLLTAIEANGFVPEQIVVEFTEREAISRFEEFTSAVRQLKSAGISVAIDHFGAGFAGLQLLAEFQPDRIKINRDLIANVHKSGPRQAIVQAIIKCCASLEIQFCAVGVELAEEWMWLESAGISQFQGHLFASPRLGGIPAIAWPEKKFDF